MSESTDLKTLRPYDPNDPLDRDIVEDTHPETILDTDYFVRRAARVAELVRLKVLEECRGCDTFRADVEVRYSYGIYAGKFCVPCAKRKFRDQCGLTEAGQGDQQELIEMGEVIDDPDDGESWASHYYDF